MKRIFGKRDVASDSMPDEKKTFSPSRLVADLKEGLKETAPKSIRALFEPRKQSGGQLIRSKKEVPLSEVPEPFDRPEEYAGSEKLVSYGWLTPDFAYYRILETAEGKLVYELHEPKITSEEFLLLEETVHVLRETISYDDRFSAPHEISHDQIIRVIDSFELPIADERKEVIIYYLKRNLIRYGKIDALFNDPWIEDITCNGANVPLYLYHQKYGNIRTNIVFDGEELNAYIIRLAQLADKQVSLTTPLVDAALPSGSRAQITYSDVISSNGSSFTIRKFRDEPITPVDLIHSKTYTPELLACIWLAIENRQSLVVAGGTASGKTSTMNAVSFFIPQESKIVSIEDTREIQLPHENWLAMHTRESMSVHLQGNIDMFALLKASLRQRPEYIIVGEVRGEEAQTLFQAMNTGHTTFSTLHAGNVHEAISRLTHAPINVPPAMFTALHLMIIQGLHYQEGKGVRRCLSFNELRVEGDSIFSTPLFTWNPQDDTVTGSITHSAVFQQIAVQNAWSWEELMRRIQVRADELRRLADGAHLTKDELGARIFAVSSE
ncbi:MAG TPA: type II/IV secretion system ATPase subunit [Methanocorpusculum sp.]|nr:type II/IV secretion system ATPase subunit [Methanocorpusculum sp.]